MNEPNNPDNRPTVPVIGKGFKIIIGLILAPPILNILAAAAGWKGGIVIVTLLIVPFTGIAAGVYTALQIGKTTGSKVLCSIFFSLGYFALCLGLCILGCSSLSAF
ncbi:MAG TPA: hypothetical protein EYQ50_17700 [Verrucomicrobiales bacterium]|nr:hypothetical protein [Verrucomicrobiales bacterium]